MRGFFIVVFCVMVGEVLCLGMGVGFDGGILSKTYAVVEVVVVLLVLLPSFGWALAGLL